MTVFSVALNSVKPSRRTAVALSLLLILPCLLSLINLTFAQSWKVHFFPAAIILAALVLGTGGGLIAGISGSLFSALLLGNPYLIVGNALFGVLVALFYKKTDNIILSVLLAYACELPWLILTDYYLVGLPAIFIARLVVVLFLANMFWASIMLLGMRPIRRYLC